MGKKQASPETIYQLEKKEAGKALATFFQFLGVKNG